LSQSDIATPRLILRLIDRPTLEACVARNAGAAGRSLGADVPPDLLGPSPALMFSLAQLDADPGYAPWSTRAILLAGAQQVVGYVRFHERPDPARLHPFGGHAAELGYSIFPGHRRRGYAGEAVDALMAWAGACHGITRFIASMAPGNTASLRLVARRGFRRIGEQIDEIDGLEHVFLREIA
jgi:[ribosomal protein S5]-alanine N-acetyltransferase